MALDFASIKAQTLQDRMYAGLEVFFGLAVPAFTLMSTE
jgi:hypothetical protein